MMISAYTNYNNNCRITLHQLVLMGPCNSTRELESSRGETRELEPSKLPVPALVASFAKMVLLRASAVKNNQLREYLAYKVPGELIFKRP